MDNRELFKILLRRKDISIFDVQNFFGLNDEKTIEELINVLQEELILLKESSNSEYPVHLFYLVKDLEEVCGNFIVENPNKKIPFYKTYLNLTQKVILETKDRRRKHKNNEYKDSFLTELFYYKDIETVTKRLASNPNLIGEYYLKEPIYRYILNNFYSSLFETRNEYQYYKELMEYILKNTKVKVPIKLSIIEDFVNHSDVIMDELKKISQFQDKKEYSYRMKEIGFLLGHCKKVLTKSILNYRVVIAPEKSCTNNQIFTIDNDETCLREDALSVSYEDNHTKITMYITNVIPYFVNKEDAQKEAFENWFTKLKDNIFDYETAVSKFSLDEGKIRDVIAYEFSFDNDNVLDTFTIYPTKISVSKNYTYDEVNDILRTKRSRDLNKEHLDMLRKIGLHLHEDTRYKQKYHMLKEIEKLITNGESDRNKYHNDAGIIISELKIASGHILAKLFLDKKIPAIYRNNQFEATNLDVEDIKNACNELDNAIEVKEKIKNTKIESYYSNHNDGHKGLNLDCYMHITTPARNYFALVNSLILEDVIINGHAEKIEMYDDFVEQLITLQNDKISKNGKIYTLK